MRVFSKTLLVMVICVAASAQFRAQAPQSSTTATVPRLVPIAGVFTPADGRPLAPVETVTLSIYADETGGSPLWEEIQSVSVDASGRYSVLLGASLADGLPLDIFASGEARWLGIRFERTGEREAPRARLTSVPYALRAADADTLGGRPASAYLLAPDAGGSDPEGPRTAPPSTTVVAPNAINSGFTNAVSKYLNNGDAIGPSSMYENSENVGIGTGAGVAVGVSASVDRLNVRFTNTSGAITGISLRNDGNTATSYSGILFYDQNGTLAQFQGFNNVTHEYRFNNIAQTGGVPDGSINFLIGGTSRFKVASTGRIGIGVENPAFQLDVAGAIKTTQGDYTLGTGNYGTWWVDGAGSFQAHLFRYGFGNGALYITNNGGGDLTGVYLLPGGNSLTSSSDERLKSDITPLTGILDRIRNIRVVSFNMASLSVDPVTGKPAVNRNVPPRTTRDGTVIKQQIGSIAQDWMKEFPEVVVEPQSDDDYYGLNYDRISVIALGGVKELHTLLTAKDAEIKALNDRVATLEQRLTRLETTVVTQANLWNSAAWMLLAPLGLVALAFYRRR